MVVLTVCPDAMNFIAQFVKKKYDASNFQSGHFGFFILKVTREINRRLCPYGPNEIGCFGYLRTLAEKYGPENGLEVRVLSGVDDRVDPTV